AVKKRVGLGYVHRVRIAKPQAEIQAIFEKTKSPKRKSVLARLLQVPPDGSIDLPVLAREAGTKPPTVRKLAQLGLITITPEPDFDLLGEEGSGFRVQGSGNAQSAATRRVADALDDQSARPQDSLPEPLTPNLEPSTIPDPNEDQRRVLADLIPRIESQSFSVHLLHGVTGSGKTEVYLRCIAEVIKQGKQSIVMVPEIALTPQTVRRFTARFPRVAVLHSGLTASQRHRFWQQCATGRADVVVGARSAVFAPLPNLGMIVVDEEHEPSYKQDQQPRYHARDVAVKRAQLESCPVILGSATPSLETWHRITSADKSIVNGQLSIAAGNRTPTTINNGQLTIDSSPKDALPYHLLSLPSRVRGLAMPHVELIDMKVEAKMRARSGVHLLSQRLEHLLSATIAKGQQAILMLNRRGYSNFVYCVSCQEPVHCTYCDTTMTYHRTASGYTEGHPNAPLTAKHSEAVHTGQLQCHYCLYSTPLPDKCPACKKKLSLFGLGTQRVEEELQKKFPDLKYARVDSDTMHSARDYEELLGRFGRGEIQVMLGTQMIAKGLDYPNVTLVGVISGDTALALPDFRAAERTFQLITQVAGRAGRGDAPGRVVLQTFLPDDPTIQAALRQDFIGFAKGELAHRKDTGLPPFGRMARIVLRDQDQDALHKRAEVLAGKALEAIEQVLAAMVARAERAKDEGGRMKDEKTSASASSLPSPIQLKGPMPCAIAKIAGYYRTQIVLQSPRADTIQRVLNLLREADLLAANDRIAVDVDPVSLL
ncbi:MAG: primosomal protein N', partial [Phycisphaerae bacterium]|nr:primosomal protein N' [Tepidisphaeraceae bacterium]